MIKMVCGPHNYSLVRMAGLSGQLPKREIYTSNMNPIENKQPGYVIEDIASQYPYQDKINTPLTKKLEEMGYTQKQTTKTVLVQQYQPSTQKYTQPEEVKRQIMGQTDVSSLLPQSNNPITYRPVAVIYEAQLEERTQPTQAKPKTQMQTNASRASLQERIAQDLESLKHSDLEQKTKQTHNEPQLLYN